MCLELTPLEREKDAVRMMEGFSFKGHQNRRSSEQAGRFCFKRKELDFRRRLLGVVCKPPYAAGRENASGGER